MPIYEDVLHCKILLRSQQAIGEEKDGGDDAHGGRVGRNNSDGRDDAVMFPSVTARLARGGVMKV
jgi:hypothetical protein